MNNYQACKIFFFIKDTDFGPGAVSWITRQNNTPDAGYFNIASHIQHSRGTDSRGPVSEDEIERTDMYTVGRC